MALKFTTPCFIRKNIPELRKKLEELGYRDNYSELHEEKTMLFVIPSYLGYTEPTFESTNEYKGNLLNGKYPIDCGTNEQLFLALAALREDSDYMQYFVYDEEVVLIPRLNQYIPKGAIYFCMVDKFEPILPNVSYHKATPAELIEHFKDEPKEYILCAAIKRKEPRSVARNPYYEGQNDILDIELGYRHHDIILRFGDELDRRLDAQGFYTSKGRFVGRKEAYEIAEKANQIAWTIGVEGTLYSENLY